MPILWAEIERGIIPMKSSDLKVVAIILSIALFFTIITSNAVSIASVVILAKGGSGTGAVQQEGTATTPDGATQTTPSGSTSTTPSGSTSTTPGGSTSTAPGGSTSTTPGSSTTTPSGSTSTTPSGSTSTTPGGSTSTTPGGDSGSTNSNQWSKEQTFEFYKKSAHEMATTGKAAYNKIEWQVLENLQVGSVGGVLQPVIDSFMTTKEEASVQEQAKGSDEAKSRFPDCTLADMSKVASATKKDLPNGNYEITIIMMDEDTPMNEESSFLAKVTSSVLFWEDIQRTIDEDVPVVGAINSRSVNYKGYKITAEMTKDGKFVSLGHYATVDIKANAKITVFTLDIGGILYNNCEYSDFKY